MMLVIKFIITIGWNQRMADNDDDGDDAYNNLWVKLMNGWQWW